MPRKKQEERWVTGKEALEILKANSGRDDIPESYVRTLARDGKVAVKELDGRTNVYLFSDLEHRIVRKRNEGKGETRAARAAGSRRKASAGGNNKEESAA